MRTTILELVGEVTRNGKHYQATHSLPTITPYLPLEDIFAQHQEVIHYYLDMMIGVGTVDLNDITWSCQTFNLEYHN